MNVNIKGKEISYNNKKESLLVSYIAQNLTEKQFRSMIDRDLLEFVYLIPEMEPQHLVILRWNARNEEGYPIDHYGIGAIACESVKPWEQRQRDHLIAHKKIQHKNTFAQIKGVTLVNQIILNYDSRVASVIEGKDYNYFLPEALEGVLKIVGFEAEYSTNSLKQADTDLTDFI